MDRREGVEVGGKEGVVLTTILMEQLTLEGTEEGAKVVGIVYFVEVFCINKVYFYRIKICE